MQTVILAAGRGMRLLPLTEQYPKVMLPIGGKPILEWIVESLKEAGAGPFVMVIGYKKEVIEDYFEDGSSWGIEIEYVKQEVQAGTADAIQMVENHVSSPFLAVNGDILTTPEVIRQVINSPHDNAMAITRSDNPYDYGVVMSSDGKVIEVLEKVVKPPSDLINVGIYKLTSEIFNTFETLKPSVRGELEFTDSLLRLEELFVEQIDGWLDIGRPWDMLDANAKLLENLEHDVKGEVEPYATIKPPVLIEEGALVRSGSYVVGPVIIGRDSDVGPNCYVRPGSSIGENVRIGNGVEIKNSIIMDGTKIGHHSYVGDSVIGRGCNFGAGTKIANLRTDEKIINVLLNGEMLSSGMRKFGAVMGDGVKTGINCTLNCGVVVESNSLINPGTILMRNYP